MWIVACQLTDRQNSETPRHTEVDQERAVALEPDNQIFAATIDRRDTLALKLGRDLLGRKRPGEPLVEDLDLLEGAAGECRREACADGLDLGQLGHAPSLAGR